MATKNVVVDGNFEIGGTWIPVAPAGIVSDGNALTGSRCLRFINQSMGGLQRTFQVINVVRGARYELYFWAKRTGRMDVWAAYDYKDANGVSQTVHAPSMLNTVTGSYTRQSWSFTVPSNATSSTIGLFILSGGNAGDTTTAWIDNVELWGEEYIPPLPDPGPHPTGYNHLTNGKFETAEAWRFYTLTSIVTDSTNAKEGTRCLRFPYKSTAGMQYTCQDVNLVPGKEYILSFFAKRSGRLDVWAGYSYTDTNGVNQKVHGPSLLSQMPDNGGYRRQQYRFTVPATASSNYCVYIHGGNDPVDTGVSAYVDDVVLVRTDGGGGEDDMLRTGYVNAVETAVRASMSASGTLLGRYPLNAPIGYMTTSNADWHQTYYGFKPSNVGYTMSNLITSTAVTKARLLADIAEFWYGRGTSKADFGMVDDWCQWFVNWCVTQACLVPGNSWVTDTNCTGGWGALGATAIQTPSLGYIFYTKSGSDTVSHTGIVVEEISSTKCMVVDGNYDGSSSLTRREMDLNNLASGVTLLGFVKPVGM